MGSRRPGLRPERRAGRAKPFPRPVRVAGRAQARQRSGLPVEEKNSVIGGRTGYADVFRRGAFAWENKAPGKNLDAALKQLLSYRAE